MAKRKNPLKDLDAFLKQEATSIVKPENKAEPQASVTSEKSPLATSEDIIMAIQNLASKDSPAYKKELFEIIKSSLEHLNHTNAEDKMLINTILYLKNKDNWKEAIKDYWQVHG